LMKSYVARTRLVLAFVDIGTALRRGC
jgi:hypothetical protein